MYYCWNWMLTRPKYSQKIRISQLRRTFLLKVCSIFHPAFVEKDFHMKFTSTAQASKACVSIERVIEGKGSRKAKTRREGWGKENSGRSTSGSIWFGKGKALNKKHYFDSFSLRDGDNLPLSNTKSLLVTRKRKEIRLVLGGLSRLIVF